MLLARTGLALAYVLAALLGTANASPLGMANASPRTSDEIGALGAAENFAYAWATRNETLGDATTDFGHGEGSPGPAATRAYFLGLSSPHHAAFAIERLERKTDGAYACTITLYEYLYAGRGHGNYDGKTVTIELRKRNNAWKVVAVPGLYGS